MIQKNDKLKSFSLHCSDMSRAGLSFCSALLHNTTLLSLTLRSVGFNECEVELEKALETNRTLRYLRIQSEMKPETCSALLRGIAKNSSIQELR